MKKSKVKAYAYVSASINNGYGHVTVRLYELFTMSSGATFAAQCQSGGLDPLQTYGWKHGLSIDYSLADTQTLKTGYLLSRRIDKGMDAAYKTLGSPKSFADYALRFLQASGVRKVHVNTRINIGYSELSDLPTFDAIRDGDSLFNLLHALEGDVVSRT